MEKKSLREITNHEAGIVVYGNEVIACNWEVGNTNGGMPILSPIGTLMFWPNGNMETSESYDVADIRDALPGKIVPHGKDENGMLEVECEGMEIIYDENGDIPALFGYDIGCGADVLRDDNGEIEPQSGTVYKIGDALVIAPDLWN